MRDGLAIRMYVCGVVVGLLDRTTAKSWYTLVEEVFDRITDTHPCTQRSSIDDILVDLLESKVIFFDDVQFGYKLA